MKQFIITLLAVIGVLAVAVCLQPVDETAMEAVSGALSHTGYEVTVTEEQQDFLRGERYRLTLNHEEGNAVTVYVYKNADEAQKDADCITEDGFGVDYMGSGIRVEWVAEPHFFLYQNVIVQYVGTDRTVLTALQDLCGEQLAGMPISLQEEWISQPAPDEPEILLEVLPDSVRSDGLTIQLSNHSSLVGEGADVLYGEAFSLLQKMTMISCGVSKADETQPFSETTVTWEPVPMNCIFDELAYILPEGEQREQQVALPDLASGEYRITKEILYRPDGQADYSSFEIYADFVVPEAK